jgi:hypothetical protein
MITANQLYKQSNSSIPFKEWLKETQQQGMLDNHEKMYNLIEGQEGDTEMEESEETTDAPVTKMATTNKTTTTKSTNPNQMRNLIALVGVCFLIYGLTKANAN